MKPRKRSFRKVEHVQLQKFYFGNFDFSTNQKQWCQTSRVVSHMETTNLRTASHNHNLTLYSPYGADASLNKLLLLPLAKAITVYEKAN